MGINRDQRLLVRGYSASGVMLIALALGILASSTLRAEEPPFPISIRVQLSSKQGFCGDPLHFVVIARNDGLEPVEIPTRFVRENGTLSVEATYEGTNYVYRFKVKRQTWMEVRSTVLKPNEEVIVAWDSISLPPIGLREDEFWKNAVGEDLHIGVSVGHRSIAPFRFSEAYVLRNRPPAEQKLLDDALSSARLYQTRHPDELVPRPSIHLPDSCRFFESPIGEGLSIFDVVADHQEEISPGSLRNVIEFKQRVAKLDELKWNQRPVQAADVHELSNWLIALSDAERYFLADQALGYYYHRAKNRRMEAINSDREVFELLRDQLAAAIRLRSAQSYLVLPEPTSK